MQNTEITTTTSAHKNYAPTVKTACWAYLVTAMLSVFTGPHWEHGNAIFLLVTVFAGATIYLIKTSEEEKEVESEKATVSWLMLAFMSVNAFFIWYGEHHHKLGYPDGPTLWIANRFLYLFGLAFFMPALVEPKLGKKLLAVAAITVAAACFFFAWYFSAYEKHSAHRPASHIAAEIKPKGGKAEPWYPVESLFDDILMSIAVGLWLSLFTVEMRKPNGEEAKKNNAVTAPSDGPRAGQPNVEPASASTELEAQQLTPMTSLT